MTKTLSAVGISLCLAAGCSTAAQRERRASGTVAAVDATHVEVTDVHGARSSYLLTPDTKYARGYSAAAASHVAVGQRVVIVYVEDVRDKKRTATEVLIQVQPPSPPQPPLSRLQEGTKAGRAVAS